MNKLSARFGVYTARQMREDCLIVATAFGDKTEQPKPNSSLVLNRYVYEQPAFRLTVHRDTIPLFTDPPRYPYHLTLAVGPHVLTLDEGNRVAHYWLIFVADDSGHTLIRYERRRDIEAELRQLARRARAFCKISTPQPKRHFTRKELDQWPKS